MYQWFRDFYTCIILYMIFEPLYLGHYGDIKQLESCAEMSFRRRMEKISLTERAIKEEVLRRAGEERVLKDITEGRY